MTAHDHRPDGCCDYVSPDGLESAVHDSPAAMAAALPGTIRVEPDDVPRLVRAGVTVYSYGYGDAPGEYPALDVDDLYPWDDLASADADGAVFLAAIVNGWAPFRADLLDVDHVDHLAESDPSCLRCQSTYDAPADDAVVDPDGALAYALEYARAMVLAAVDLHGDLRRLEGIGTDDLLDDLDNLAGFLARQGSAAIRPADRAVARDLASALYAATSPHVRKA